MKPRLQALRAFRWNYKWRGVWVWLKGRNCFICGGNGAVVRWDIKLAGSLRIASGRFVQRLTACSRCGGKPKRGYHRILTEPQKVIVEQAAMAEGVFV